MFYKRDQLEDLEIQIWGSWNKWTTPHILDLNIDQNKTGKTRDDFKRLQSGWSTKKTHLTGNQSKSDKNIKDP